MRIQQSFIAFTFLVLSSCVGTDYVGDPPLFEPARIEVAPEVQAVEVGRTVIFTATYYDSLGSAVTGLSFDWSSSDPTTVAIDASGTATALKVGQARIRAQARNVISDPVLMTVVADPNQVATVEVSPASATLTVGGTLQYTGVARNLSGTALPGKTFTWRSSNAAVASVNPSGLATALAPGETTITVEVEGVESAAVRLNVASTSRSGSFQRNTGTSYNVSGTAVLEQQSNGSLTLELGTDFSSSNGPGLEVLLSNSNTVGANSISLGRLQKTSGVQSYNVPNHVTLTTYDWVIIHCVPFNATFGYAQLR